MAFTNSPLATFTSISPNRNSPRNQPITKITIHHMAGVMSLEQFASIVMNPGRQMSSNYAIDKDGRIGLFCPEQDRSWCSSSAWNDNRAITIEVSNSAFGDASGWPISPFVLDRLVALCVDICKRNGIKKLEYTGDRNGSLTRHCDLAQTLCPGPYIKAKTGEICDRVNRELSIQVPQKPAAVKKEPVKTNNTTTFKVGDLVKIKKGSNYYTGGSIPSWVIDENWYISSISGDRAVLGLNEDKNRNIQSPINTCDISLVKACKQFSIKLNASDNIYTTPGGAIKGQVGGSGVFTIIDERSANGVTYGKLKSGAGWVIIKNNTAIKPGDKVKVLKAVQYGNNKPFKTYVSTYYVLEISGNRVVISSDGKNVTAAVDKKNLQKV